MLSEHACFRSQESPIFKKKCMTIHFTNVCDEKNKQKSNVCDVQMTKLNVKVQNLRYNDGGDRFSKT